MRRTLIGVIVLLMGVPALFYLNFGEVGPIGFGLSVFLVCATLLLGLGRYANEQESRYAPSNAIIIRNDWMDKVTFIGVVFFVLGPFIGLFVSSSTALLPTESSWRWQYAVRVVFAVVMPLATAVLILVFHVERRSLPVYVPLVLLIAALPAWSGVRPLIDLYYGPRKEIIRHGCSFIADKLACYCNGKEVFCPNMKKDEEIVVLPWTRRVLAQRTLTD
jgi:hypothetical protein